MVRASDVKTEKVGDLAWSMEAKSLTFIVRQHFVPVHEPIDQQTAIGGLVPFAEDILFRCQMPHPVIQ
jgi:hypothetical protein